METRLSGNAFQSLAAATGKARLPTVESLKGGTTRRLVPEKHKVISKQHNWNSSHCASITTLQHVLLDSLRFWSGLHCVARWTSVVVATESSVNPNAGSDTSPRPFTAPPLLSCGRPMITGCDGSFWYTEAAGTLSLVPPSSHASVVFMFAGQQLQRTTTVMEKKYWSLNVNNLSGHLSLTH